MYSAAVILKVNARRKENFKWSVRVKKKKKNAKLFMFKELCDREVVLEDKRFKRDFTPWNYFGLKSIHQQPLRIPTSLS
jgi:hypothetical protein